MTTLAHSGPAAPTPAKPERPILASLIVIALILGLVLAFAGGQFGKVRFAPSFAEGLAQASETRREASDPEVVLATARKSTEVYRRLMRMNPIRYAPSLATSLHNLSVGLSEVGDTTGALAAIDEAVQLRRLLAKSDPSRYGAKLEQSLQLLVQIEAAR